jgi:hypothetical protein
VRAVLAIERLRAESQRRYDGTSEKTDWKLAALLCGTDTQKNCAALKVVFLQSVTDARP